MICQKKVTLPNLLASEDSPNLLPVQPHLETTGALVAGPENMGKAVGAKRTCRKGPVTMAWLIEHCLFNPASACWEWQLHRDRDGYGRTKENGKYLRAHVKAYQLWKGEFPNGMLVLHSCDNAPCCNPDHLFLGSHQDNVRDKVAKGRTSRKTRKLTFEQAMAVKGDPRSCRIIAQEFGIAPVNVWKIKAGKSYTIAA